MKLKKNSKKILNFIIPYNMFNYCLLFLYKIKYNYKKI